MIDEKKKKNTVLTNNNYEKKSIIEDLFHFFGKNILFLSAMCHIRYQHALHLSWENHIKRALLVFLITFVHYFSVF